MNQNNNNNLTNIWYFNVSPEYRYMESEGIKKQKVELQPTNQPRVKSKDKKTTIIYI